MKLKSRLYRQFDADTSRAVPGEAYGGWHDVTVELAPAHTAVVVMHAWDCGSPGQFPGWERAVEYQGRARAIMREVFPRLLAAVRASALPLFHVVGGGDYFRQLDGWRKAVALAGPSPEPAPVAPPDAAWQTLRALRERESFPGDHNQPDIRAGFARLDFAPEARPLPDEPIAEDGHQLAAVCRERGINHLVYAGFAINWCLLMSPGGMVDMKRRGALCSVLREAVTAVENAATAREEREKEQALWRVSVEFGCVFGVDDFIAALPPRKPAA